MLRIIRISSLRIMLPRRRLRPAIVPQKKNEMRKTEISDLPR